MELFKLAGGEKMEFVIEALEEVTPKHPICSSKPFRAALPIWEPIIGYA
jgi:hypothetical protein